MVDGVAILRQSFPEIVFHCRKKKADHQSEQHKSQSGHQIEHELKDGGLAIMVQQTGTGLFALAPGKIESRPQQVDPTW